MGPAQTMPPPPPPPTHTHNCTRNYFGSCISISNKILILGAVREGERERERGGGGVLVILFLDRGLVVINILLTIQ